MSLLVARHSLIVHATEERVWQVLADSDRSNRVFRDFAPLRFEPLETDGPERLRAWTKVGPFTVVHDEAPTQFVRNERIEIARRCYGGPFRHFRILRTMAPVEPGAFRIDLLIEVVPRWPLMNFAVRATLAKAVRKLAAFLEQCVQAAGPRRFKEPRTPIHEDAFARATAELSRQAGAGTPLLARLVEHVRLAADNDLVRLRPFVLADAWGADRDEVLGLMLLASLSGLLELRWDIVCPSCQTGAEQLPLLSELSAEGHCQLCDLTFDLELDRAVEAIFRPAPAVRPIPTTPFCLANVANQPLIFSQGHLLPGSPLLLKVPVVPGQYRLSLRGGVTAAVLVQASAPESLALQVPEEPALPPLVEVAPGGSVSLEYAGTRGLHAKIDRLEPRSLAATAHRASLHPLFRRHFSSELLKPGLALAISRMSLVFTDLVGSTAMYAALGEPRAFRIVLDHFELLRTIVESHRGILVKTLGDAVMAAFPDESCAFAASVAMLDAFPDFAAQRPEAKSLALKVGAFTGPCYAVRANGLLDYFGQTVNTAARIQGEASEGQLLVTAEAGRAAVAEARIDPARLSAPFAAILKGLPQPLELVRIQGSLRQAQAERGARSG